MNETTLKFLNRDGSFAVEHPERTSYLYFPLCNATGMKSSITPSLGGDAKLDQNSFLLAPVSAEDLQESRSVRNFWFHVPGLGVFDAAGVAPACRASAWEKDADPATRLEAGLYWQKIVRTYRRAGLEIATLSFVPSDGPCCELHEVSLKNLGGKTLNVTPTAAIPLYGRSADAIRDHRHVTCLLHRTRVTDQGMELQPSLSFDERGHLPNTLTYRVLGASDDGALPLGAFPSVEDFVGEGGSLDWPKSVVDNLAPWAKAGETVDGYEAIGALRFPSRSVPAGATVVYRIVMEIRPDGAPAGATERYLDGDTFRSAYRNTIEHWKKKADVLSVRTGSESYDSWLRWVTLQPELRRIYGCSFLPHHDYGRGGRGWRDLWQDCLALLLLDSADVRSLLLHNFAGIRIDGSNATIIGAKPGEFKADRNNIPRVWMDHGAWPVFTTGLYLDQTGDLDFLLLEQSYFKDQHVRRCAAHDDVWNPDYGLEQKTVSGEPYRGTILEHLLVQNLTAFHHVGEHNILLLEGADWNDGLDMARQRGESAAFTSFYGANLVRIADWLEVLASRAAHVELAEEVLVLLEGIAPSEYADKAKKRAVLDRYYDLCTHSISGRKTKLDARDLAGILRAKGEAMLAWIREREWLTNRDGSSWFNGYYDNDGRRLEGDAPKGPRMTLTGQVFAVMSGAATDEQVAAVVKSVDRYLFDEKVGGPRLNTDFGEVLMNVGRCYGFAYGHKENGAMFCHMAVMYAYALLSRGFAAEGRRVLDSIFRQASDFERSRIYPGIPEYFDARGRGLYSYLTGAASWYVLTILTRVFGVRGSYGNLVLDPMLGPEHFGDDGRASVRTKFRGIDLAVEYTLVPASQSAVGGISRILRVTIDGSELRPERRTRGVSILWKDLDRLDRNREHRIAVELG